MAKLDLADFSRFLDGFRQRVVARAMSCVAIDHAAVESSMTQIYHMLGQATPEFVWLQSPWQLSYTPARYTFRGKRFRIAASEDALGRHIRVYVQDVLGKECFDDFFDALWNRLPHQDLGAMVWLLNRERMLNRNMDSNIELWFQHSRTMNSTNDSSFQPRRLVRPLGFRTSSLGAIAMTEIARSWSDDIEWCFSSLLRLAIAQVAREYFGLTFESNDNSQLDSFLSLAESCHAYLCFEDVCLLTERPRELHLDANNRFHRVGGPAVQYDDQLKIYAWHGTRVPPNAVMLQPDLGMIEFETNIEIRRVFIERYGVQNYLLDSGSEIVHHDECGTLYMKELPFDEPIVMVRVTNSTPEPNGECKSYFLRVPPDIRTARAAVAWTFGMSESEYAPLVES